MNEQCASDPVLVTDAHFIVSETIAGEIFSKLSITRESVRELEAQVTQSWVVIGTAPKRPVIFAIRFQNRKVVD